MAQSYFILEWSPLILAAILKITWPAEYFSLYFNNYISGHWSLNKIIIGDIYTRENFLFRFSSIIPFINSALQKTIVPFFSLHIMITNIDMIMKPSGPFLCLMKLSFSNSIRVSPSKKGHYTITSGSREILAFLTDKTISFLA